MINKGHTKLSVLQQCKLLGIHRSGIYYKPRAASELNLELMRLMDEQYLKHPFMGSPKMHTWLTLDMNFKVNQKRVDRLYYEVMGLRALVPGIHTTKRNKAHKIYPYLLRNLRIIRPNQVWAIDITYVPMAKGFMYLVAVIDIYSRMIVSWSVSNTMTAEWCWQTVQEAINRYGTPEILNTDQGSQFTSEVFTKGVLAAEIRLSMDGKGRAIDNVFIERFWRSVKYEEIYLNPPNNGLELHLNLKRYMSFYNTERRHDKIDKQRPIDWYNHNNKEQETKQKAA